MPTCNHFTAPNTSWKRTYPIFKKCVEKISAHPPLIEISVIDNVRGSPNIWIPNYFALWAFKSVSICISSMQNSDMDS